MDFLQWFKTKDLVSAWVFNEFNYPILFTDDRLKLVFYNKLSEKFFNIKTKKVLGKSIFEVIPELSDKSIYYSKVLSGERVVLDEGYSEIRIFPLNVEGKTIGTVTQIIDRTEEVVFQSLFNLIKGFNKKN
ncbi:MAG: PAS domain-containing protein, partial [Dictyoglomus sp.]